jgi:membrane-bound serine protease (ClpP class)
LASLIAACGALAQQDSILWIEVNGYISPGTVRHFEEAFAVASRYSAVLVTIDTLGGQADSMLSIVELIQRSPVPVIGFVYPEGGKAMSAGSIHFDGHRFCGDGSGDHYRVGPACVRWPACYGFEDS